MQDSCEEKNVFLPPSFSKQDVEDFLTVMIHFLRYCENITVAIR